MESLRNQFQHVDDGIVEDDQILNNLEGLTKEVIFGALHCKMVVILGPQCIISHH